MRNEARKPKSRMISFRVDEDYLSRLDALAQQTSYSRAEVLRRCLVGAPLKSTVDAQALTLVRQLALRQTMETRALRRKLAIQRKAIQKTWHPGTWRHFVASRAAQRDARAIRLRERERGGSEQEREL